MCHISASKSSVKVQLHLEESHIFPGRVIVSLHESAQPFFQRKRARFVIMKEEIRAEAVRERDPVSCQAECGAIKFIRSMACTRCITEINSKRQWSRARG